MIDHFGLTRTATDILFSHKINAVALTTSNETKPNSIDIMVLASGSRLFTKSVNLEDVTDSKCANMCLITIVNYFINEIKEIL